MTERAARLKCWCYLQPGLTLLTNVQCLQHKPQIVWQCERERRPHAELWGQQGPAMGPPLRPTDQTYKIPSGLKLCEIIQNQPTILLIKIIWSKMENFFPLSFCEDCLRILIMIFPCVKSANTKIQYMTKCQKDPTFQERIVQIYCLAQLYKI